MNIEKKFIYSTRSPKKKKKKKKKRKAIQMIFLMNLLVLIYRFLFKKSKIYY